MSITQDETIEISNNSELFKKEDLQKSIPL